MTTTVEQDIKDKGLDAPRVTVADVEAEIASEYYFTAAEGVALGTIAAGGGMPVIPAPLNLLTFCVLILKNGYTVSGESACTSVDNFDADTGRIIAYQHAAEKIWPLLGYALRTELSRPVLTEADALADLNGTPRPTT